MELLFSSGGHEHGAADAVLALPRAVGDGADIAGSGDPDIVVFRDFAVVVDPKSAVGVFLVFVVGGDGPGAGGEDDLGSHSGEGAADDLVFDEGVGADHDANFAEGGFDSGEGVAGFIVMEAGFDFIDFSMDKEKFAGGVDKDGGVIDFATCLFDDAGADHDV